MDNIRNRTAQRGVVLVVGLLLLLAMTLVAVAGMSATHMQERMAGNHRTQALAFEAASIGAMDAVNYYIERRDDEANPLLAAPRGPCRTPGSAGWPATTADTVNAASLGMPEGVELRRSIACVNDPIPECKDSTVECPDFRTQLLVLNQGRVFIDGQLEPVAQREIEVRIDYRLPPGTPLSGCSGICMPGCDYNPPSLANAKNFNVDGGKYGDPAITVGCQKFANELIDDATDKGRVANYSWQGDGPGIRASDIGEPWDTPANVEDFGNFIKTQAQAVAATNCDTGSGNSRLAPCFVDGPYSNSGGGSQGNEWFGGLGETGEPRPPRFTYINGDASISGNSKGAGIMVVNGNLDWAGTPDFHGIIVVLGGSFTISGGGGGDTIGSIVVANTNDATAANFGKTTLDISGGGKHSIQYDCDQLVAQWNTLFNVSGLTKDALYNESWKPECGPGDAADPDALGPPEPTITSWRESLGWRRDAIWNNVISK